MTDRTIWVYRIPVNVLSAWFATVEQIPAGATLLHVEAQHRDIAMWYEIPDPNAPKQDHTFQIFGTGTGPIPDGRTYLGTTLHEQGELVLHVYEVTDDDH